MTVLNFRSKERQVQAAGSWAAGVTLRTWHAPFPWRDSALRECGSLCLRLLGSGKAKPQDKTELLLRFFSVMRWDWQKGYKKRDSNLWKGYRNYFSKDLWWKYLCTETLNLNILEKGIGPLIEREGWHK